MMRSKYTHSGVAMIELIFAIVIIAITVMSIPSMMSVAAQASKGMTIDDEVMSRLSGWTLDKFQARWDGNYAASSSGPLWISGDLNCISRGSGNVWYRINPDSMVQCDDQNRSPSNILPIYPDGNISKGIERLNGGEEPITITVAGTGETYAVNATYAVNYVDSTVVTNGNTASATWILGASENIDPNSSVTVTHLKRVVTRFRNPDGSNDATDIILTFFKSNKGN